LAKKLRSFGGKSFRKSGGSKNKKPNMNQLMQQAQKAQEEMAKKEEEFDQKTFEATAGGGVITVKMNGKHELVDIKYDADLLEEPDDFNDLIIAAVNKGVEIVDKEKEEFMGQISNNMGLPDMGF